MDLARLREVYRKTLLEDSIPFWMRHGIDPSGGINSCITDEGKVVSRDRWSWSQWRAVWVFSKLYNCIERRSEWLDAARGICDFVRNAGRLDNGHWPLMLDGDGVIRRGYESIYADGFAIYGLAELYRATGDKALLELALATFEATEADLESDTTPPNWPYPVPPGGWPHGMSMIFSMVYHELADVSGDADVRAAADRHHRKVMDNHLRKDRGLLLEWLDRDGNEIAPPEGTVVVPGHAIESMWFQIHIARGRGDGATADRATIDKATIDRAVEAIRRHLEFGWDETYGGILLACDADGRDEVGWAYHDTKLWWPHTEALYATLLAYEYCSQPWALDWHQRVHDYSYAHYPDKAYGEWRQKLDRQGRPLSDVVALPVKDPFHLPRALIYCIEVLDRLIGD